MEETFPAQIWILESAFNSSVKIYSEKELSRNICTKQSDGNKLESRYSRTMSA